MAGKDSTDIRPARDPSNALAPIDRCEALLAGAGAVLGMMKPTGFTKSGRAMIFQAAEQLQQVRRKVDVVSPIAVEEREAIIEHLVSLQVTCDEAARIVSANPLYGDGSANDRDVEAVNLLAMCVEECDVASKIVASRSFNEALAA